MVSCRIKLVATPKKIFGHIQVYSPGKICAICLTLNQHIDLSLDSFLSPSSNTTTNIMGKGYYEVAGRQFPEVTWYTDPSLRRTYLCLMMVVLTSATNGYDGSMMNGLQTLTPW